MRCVIVERWNSHIRIRQDLYGFIDIIALDTHNKQTIGVQCFGSDFQPHLRKITLPAEDGSTKIVDAAKDWLYCNNKIWLLGWRKLKRKNKDGGWSKLGFWTPRLEELRLEDFPVDAFDGEQPELFT